MEKSGYHQTGDEPHPYENDLPVFWDSNKYPGDSMEDGVQVEMPVEAAHPFDVEKDFPLKDRRYENTCISKFQSAVANFFRSNSGKISKAVLFAVFVGYTVYFGFAIHTSMKGATVLIVMTSLTVFFYVYGLIRDKFGQRIYTSFLGPAGRWLSDNWHILQWLVIPAILIALILYVSLVVIQDIQQLQSLSGMVVFVGGLYLFSRYPNQILWRPVVFGFGLQFVMGIVVLRTDWGFHAVRWLSNEITEFINYAMEGAAIVFGNPMLLLHPFAFTAMPMLIYIGAVMSILYYLGITQLAASKIGWFVQATMGTTAIESLGVGANIFLNGMDTMLMLRHYLHKLTSSEFHCFLVGNHSTVAGFAFAIFVMFGAPPQHLLSAAVMSAPAAIAVCKLSYPETEVSITTTQEDVQLEKGEETNVIEAGANGASVAGTTVVAVVVNYIGFMSILAFINSTLSYMGGRVGYPQLSFQVICSYLFFPISMVMGIEINECQEVAKLVGLKVFTSEMLAYQELGVSISKGLVSARSASIATYALCGFSSLSTLAIAVGVWNALCPQKTQEMSNQLPRVIINANISCFMTACVAGLMYDESIEQGEPGTGLITALLGFLPGLMYDESIEQGEPGTGLITALLGFLPGYKVIWDLLPGI